MAEQQTATQTRPKDGPSLTVAGQDAGRKVELDLDDAPFLKEEKSTPPAVVKEQTLPQNPEEAVTPAPRKKKRIVILAAAGVFLLLAGAAAWWFFLRTPPPPPPPPPEPEVIVVPTEAAVPPSLERVKELAAFVIPRNVNGSTHFLFCRFSTVSKDERVNDEIDRKILRMRDALYYYLSGKSDEFLLNHANSAEIKKNLMVVLNDYLTQGKIEDILFESYLNE